MIETQDRGAVRVLRVDNPPVNALGAAVRQALHDALVAAEADASVAAVVLLGKGRTFVAGADIREFSQPPGAVGTGDVFGRLERCPKPVVAAIHGHALGGGLELALCCDYRIAVPAARLGLPEVNLGLIPGAGGTQRLPRIVGVKEALARIVSAEPMDPLTAQRIGLLDAIVSGDLEAGAVAFAENVVRRGGARKRRVRDLPVPLGAPGGPDAVFAEASRLAATRRRGQHAPERAIDAVRFAFAGGDFDAGLAEESRLFRACLADPQSQAMIHAFFGERTAGRVPGVDAHTPTTAIRSAAVLGAGTMGAGIATSLLRAGIPTHLVDVGPEALERGLEIVKANLARAAEKGSLSSDEAAAAVGRLRGASSYELLRDVDLVIEAVFEDLDLKREVFRQLDAIVKPEAILATNTSTLDVDAIAASTRRPSQVVGMHFFSPAHVMRLLEVVRGAATSPSTLATALAVGKKLGKVCVVAGNCDGFIGNRMLAAYRREADFLVEEGATPREVDAALERFGLAMGPFAMADLAGLDVGYRIRQRRGKPAGVRYASTVADRLVERGRLGQKTGGGFYRYDAGSRTPRVDPDVEALVLAVSAELGIARRPIAEEEIVERCILALVLEGAKVLEEGIALRGSDIDVVYLTGYGFPVFRGGPMFHADALGLARVVERLEALAAAHGPHWTPPSLLRERAARGERLSE